MEKLIVAVIVFAASLLSCKKENPTETIPAGAFQYKAYDSTGSLVVQGWMTLVMEDSTRITGEWHFSKVDDPQNIGPHFGDGQLVAGFYGGSLSANLNPKYVDNNVFLNGQYAGNTFSGNWFWEGFPGVLNYGSFQAVKQ